MRALRIALQDRPHTRALLTGDVTVGGLTLESVHSGPIVGAFRKMVRSRDFDICEMALTTYICARRYGKELTAIPVFPFRDFPQSAIRVRREGAHRPARSLEGQRIGVRAYTVTTGVWGRAALAEQLGVDLDSITWVVADEEHVSEYALPANVTVLLGADLDAMLAAGELAATIGIASTDPDVVPMLGDGSEALERAWLDKDVYPINHTVVVRNELLSQDPALAGELCDVFATAKQQALDRLNSTACLDDGERSLRERARFVGGDPLPYGIEVNRVTLETLGRHAAEQQIVTEPVDVDAWFSAPAGR